jgi:hypothetical protein
MTVSQGQILCHLGTVFASSTSNADDARWVRWYCFARRKLMSVLTGYGVSIIRNFDPTERLGRSFGDGVQGTSLYHFSSVPFILN